MYDDKNASLKKRLLSYGNLNTALNILQQQSDSFKYIKDACIFKQ